MSDTPTPVLDPPPPPPPPAPPGPPTRAIRQIQAPSTGAVYRNGDIAGQPKPLFEGVLLGQRYVQGVAHVDEEATWDYADPRTTAPLKRRVWHELVRDFGHRDITPADQPPRYPLPPMKPGRPVVAGQADEDRILTPLGPRRAAPTIR